MCQRRGCGRFGGKAPGPPILTSQVWMLECLLMAKGRRKNRRRWTAEEARTVLGEQRRSGLSIAAFSRKHGHVAERLYRWSRKLGLRDNKRVVGSRSSADALTVVEVVGRVANPVHAAPISRDFEVTLCCGHRVVVPAGFAATDFSRLVAVLSEERC